MLRFSFIDLFWHFHFFWPKNIFFWKSFHLNHTHTLFLLSLTHVSLALAYPLSLFHSLKHTHTHRHTHTHSGDFCVCVCFFHFSIRTNFFHQTIYLSTSVEERMTVVERDKFDNKLNGSKLLSIEIFVCLRNRKLIFTLTFMMYFWKSLSLWFRKILPSDT